MPRRASCDMVTMNVVSLSSSLLLSAALLVVTRGVGNRTEFHKIFFFLSSVRATLDGGADIFLGKIRNRRHKSLFYVKEKHLPNICPDTISKHFSADRFRRGWGFLYLTTPGHIWRSGHFSISIQDCRREQ